MGLLTSITGYLKANRAFSQGKVKCECVDINLTGNCTYDCLFCECQQLPSGSDLTKAELFNLADQMAEEGINCVFFGGGEPLMRPDFLELLRYFSGKGIRISTITNGSLPNKLTPEVLAVIDQCVDTLVVSVDSSVPEQYNELRNHNRAFELGIATLERLSSLENCKKGITAVICRSNYQGFPGLVDLAKKYGFGSVVFQPVSDGTNYPELPVKVGKTDLMLRPEDFQGLKESFEQTEEAANRCGIRTNIRRLLPWVFRYFDNHANGRIFYHGMVNAFNCIVAFNRICIRHNGDVQLCALVPGRGNIRHSSLRELIDARNPVKEQLRKGMLTEQCRKCFCGMDANLSFSMTYRPLSNLRQLLPLVKARLLR